MHLSVTHDRLPDGTLVLRPAGEVDLASAGQLRTIIEVALNRVAHHAGILVDLRQVSFLDCAGLRVLAEAHTQANRRGTPFAVINPSPMAHRLLTLTGTNHLLGSLHERFGGSNPTAGRVPDRTGAPRHPTRPPSTPSRDATSAHRASIKGRRAAERAG